MSEGIKINISGDSSSLSASLKSAQAELGKTAIAAQKMDSSLASIGKNAGQSIFNLTEKLRVLESNVFTEKSRSKIAAFNKEIEATKLEITALQNAGTTGFNNLGEAINKVGNPVSAAYGAIRKLAYILPGVGIAGIIGFATEPIIKWLTSVKEATGDAKILEDVIKEGAKGGSEQVAHLTILKQKLDDVNKPASERIKIAAEYNKTAAEGNKINVDEINNLTLINAQIDKQIGLIKQQSLAKAAQAKIAEFANKSIEAEFKLQEALDQVGISEDKVAKSIENRGKIQDKQLQKQRQSLDVGPNKLVAVDPKFKQAIENVELVDKKLEGLLIKKQSAAYELNRVINLLQPDLADSAFDGSTDKVKKIETIADVLKKLRLELDVLNTKELELHTDEAKAKISAIEGTIKTLIEKFGKPGKENTISLFAEIRQIEFVEALKKTLQTQVKGDPIKIEPIINIEPIIKVGGIDELRRKLREQSLAIVKEQTKIVQSTASDAFASIGEALGSVVEGKGNFLGKLFSGIFKSIGAGLRQLGAYAIATSKLILGLKATIGTTLGIIGGIALIALGTAISAAASNVKGPSFATGVRNFQGGGIVNVGERGPERIFLPTGSTVQPNNELQAYGGGGVTLQPSIHYEGTGFRIMLNRIDATIRRNG